MQESGEMYLETIYVLSLKKDKVRSIDIAEYMNYSKPSVSRGIHILIEQDYIDIAEDGSIKLTRKGLDKAKSVYERHLALSAIFKEIGVDAKVAEEDACRVEHYISEETFKALKKYFKLD